MLAGGALIASGAAGQRHARGHPGLLPTSVLMRETTLATRIDHIDGLRGWASLSVLCFHMLWETFGSLYPVLRNPFTSFPLDGRLAVYVFFVLSGDALSTPYFRGGDRRAVTRLAAKRYFRLTIPILMTCLSVYLLMQLSLTPFREAAAVVHRQEWLGSFLAFEPSLVHALRFSLVDVYINADPTRSYDPFLWTMSIELIGSMLVFLVLYAWKDLTRPALCVVAAALFLFMLGSLFCLFFAGIAFSHWRATGALARFAAARWQRVATAAGLAAIVASVWVRGLPWGQQMIMGGMACAVVLVAVCHVHAGAIRFFSNGISRFLGRISFPVYLVQFPVLISVTSLLILHFEPRLSLGVAIGIGLFSTALVLLLSVGFEALESRLLRATNTQVARALA
ncbi:MAG TPA: acyltransferase [Burkholderiaceae bacterium]|nr:acyltransferase [Burkholderiaceae bacterium]